LGPLSIRFSSLVAAEWADPATTAQEKPIDIGTPPARREQPAGSHPSAGEA
jgi:hypothetical protein